MRTENEFERRLELIRKLLEEFLRILIDLKEAIRSLNLLNVKSISLRKSSRQVYRECDITRHQLLQPCNILFVQASMEILQRTTSLLW